MELMNFSEMTTIEIIGNIIGLIAIALMIITGLLKTKKNILILQTIQIGFSSAGDFLLGGISGGIANIINIIRNILCYKNLMNIPIKIVLSVLTIGIPFLFGSVDLFFFLPIIASVAYIWFMEVKDVVKFKLLIVANLICWVFFDFHIHFYTSAIFGAIATIVTFVSACKIYYKRKKENDIFDSTTNQ